MSIIKHQLILSFVVVILLISPQLISGSDGPSRGDEGLVGQWDFMEGGGQIVEDRSGIDNFGILGISTNSDRFDPSWGEGVHGGALDFDGQDDHMTCGNDSSLQFGTGSFSVEAWVHVDSNLTDNLGGIMTKYDRDLHEGFFLDTTSSQRYGGWGDAYGQVSFGMNDGHVNDSWNVAVGQYGTSNAIYDIVVYDGSIFAITSQGDLVEWTRSGWAQRAPVYEYRQISSLAVFDGRIYGGVSSGGGELLEWDGSTWKRAAQTHGSQQILSLGVFNGKLYGGTYPNGNLLEWNGFGAWVEVAPQYAADTEILQLCVFNGRLFGLSEDGLLQWNGVDRWIKKVSQLNGPRTMTVYNGKLYSADSVLYEWNGLGNWMTRSDPMTSGVASELCSYNGKLYTGTTTGLLYEWDGTQSWLQRAPVSDYEYLINAMVVFNGKLFSSTTGYGQLLEWSSGCAVTLDIGLQKGWNQIVGVRDNEEERLLLYLNGELMSLSDIFDPSDYDLKDKKHLLIGHGTQDYLSGMIDRVRVFNRSLTSSEISEDYDFFTSEWRPPMPPSSPWISSGDLFVDLTWGYPISNGTNPLTGFRIYRGYEPDALVLINRTDDRTLTFTDTNIDYGVTYYYLVNSYSDAGEVMSEDTLEAIPLGVPTVPMNISVHSGDEFVNISWRVPVMTKGSNITEYRIERGLSLDSFSDLIILGEEKRHYNDTIVENRQTYYYRVFARNDVGESGPSDNVSAVPKKLAPAINNLIYCPCDMGAELSWSKSPDRYFRFFNVYRGVRELISGGLMGEYYSNSDMTNLSFKNQDYLVDFDWGTDPPIPRMEDNEFSVRWQGYIKADISGSYKINIRADGGVRVWIDNIKLIDAWNDAYYEKLSTAVFLITGEHQIRIDYFNKENRSSIKLSWVPPEGDPHVIPTSNLYGFYISYEQVIQTEETTYKDEDLEIGKIYYYYVRAVNDAGESLMGNIIEVYPIGLPEPPTHVVLITGDGFINVTWEPPLDVKGSPIVEYKIYRAVGVQNVMLYANTSGEQLFFNDTDIINGETYFFYVIGMNEAGDSEPSQSVMIIPIGKPSPPRNPKIEEHADGLKITWAASKVSGGADLKGFNVYRSVNGGNMTFIYWVNDFLTLGYIDIDVYPGNNYTYWITTLNEAGESQFSDNVSFLIPPVVVVDDDDDDDDDVDPVSKDKEFPVIPVVIGVIVLIILIAVVLFFFIRRNRKTEQQLLMGPVQVGAGAGGDETFGIFHPDQVQQAEPAVQPVGQEVGYVQQPAQYEGYDQSGQYDAQQGYPQEAYPQQGSPQEGYPQQAYSQEAYPQQGYPQQGYPDQGYAPEAAYPPEQHPGQDQFQQMVQDVYYEEGTPQYDLPQGQQPVQQGYLPQQQQYPPQQQYYPEQAVQDPNYQQQPVYQQEQPATNEFFAPPEASIQPEVQEFSTHPTQDVQQKPALPEAEKEQ